jgi:hypothetical protein
MDVAALRRVHLKRSVQEDAVFGAAIDAGLTVYGARPEKVGDRAARCDGLDEVALMNQPARAVGSTHDTRAKRSRERVEAGREDLAQARSEAVE